MRVLVTGATGNVGTSLLSRLLDDPEVSEVIGVARRHPEHVSDERVRWVEADVGRNDLTPHLSGIDAVIHLAWQLQPARDLAQLARTNITGSRRVFNAAAQAGVPILLYASSVGAYAAGSKEHPVDETWDTSGIPTSTYSRQKAAVERDLNELERRFPNLRVVRFRPALIFKREAASDIQKLFMGPWLPRHLFDRRWCPVVPDHPDLRFQGVHSLDVAEAFRAALHREVRGAFNIAADPVIDPELLSRMLDARRVKVSRRMLRSVSSMSWHLRLVRSEPGWIDLALDTPLMRCERAHRELEWWPERRADGALEDLFEGLVKGEGADTPPLRPMVGWRRFARPDPSERRVGERRMP